MSNDETIDLCTDLLEQIRPILAGHPPEVQGGTLAMALAIWLAGHEPQFRDKLLTAHVEAVFNLTPTYARTIRRKLKQRAN